MSQRKSSKTRDNSKRLRVAVVAPPWLAMPVEGYGGIELVVQSLVLGLKAQGMDVELFANGARTIPGITTRSLYKTEQFNHIYEPYFESYPIVQAHLMHAYNTIKKDGSFDIIHAHVPHVGPAFWAMATRDPDIPPVLATFHGPPFSTESADIGASYNTDDLNQIKDFNRFYAACISDAMTATAPKSVQSRLLPAVHNAINPDDFPFVATKKKYFVTMARFSPYKGQHIAIKGALKHKAQLRMAGPVADITSGQRLLFELANPISSYRGNDQFRYYSDKIYPHVLRNRGITYSGNLTGKRKMSFLSNARALLFPIGWDEPFGMAVIEALACGTPVVAMNRGAMPEIITHGVNGFLANTEEEFIEYMGRVDEIDPYVCRQSVIERFSVDAMAASYIDRYHGVIERTKKQR